MRKSFAVELVTPVVDLDETYTKLSEIVRNENKSQVSGTRWTAKTWENLKKLIFSD